MSERIRLVLFLTWDVSLALWQEKGLLQREIKLYQALARQGVEVMFLSWGGAEDDKIAADLKPDIKTISLYKHIPRPKNQVLRALCSLMVPWKLRDILKKADIYKTNQMWGGWVAVVAKWLWRKPLIVRCGFELYNFTLQAGHKGLRARFVRALSALTYRAADRIVLASEEDRDFIINEFELNGPVIHVHPNWIDTELFAPRSLSEKDNHILFVGRLTAQKNLETLIDAMAETPWTLDIVGDGELKAPLAARARERGARVNFLGSVANDKLPDLYNRYPVFILPSLYEGNPKTLLEAMACGRAVVGAKAPGISSLIDDDRDGVLVESDPDSIRKAIKSLMDDPARRGRLGMTARTRIVETQSLDRISFLEKNLMISLKSQGVSSS